jgi:hypothetical protein
MSMGVRKNPARPSVSFSTRVDVETDKRVKRLRRKYGMRGPELVRLAVEALENSLAHKIEAPQPTA